MTRYGFLEMYLVMTPGLLSSGSAGIYVWSPVAEVSDWVESQLRAAAPRFKISPISESGVMGNRYHNLAGKDQELFAWLVTQFLRDGWEPFAIHRQEHYLSGAASPITHYSFRKVL